jgi:hypothetical protein
MSHDNFQAGTPAPYAGVYEELNVFGRPSGRVTVMDSGEAFPATPRGFTWRPLAEQSIPELRARAAQYRQMADSARTAIVADSLRKLADRFDRLADQREQDACEKG